MTASRVSPSRKSPPDFCQPHNSIGGAVGLAALVSLAAARFESQTGAGIATAQASVDSFQVVFWVSAVMLLAAATLSLRLPALRQQTDLAALVH